MANRDEFAHDTHKREVEISRSRCSLILEQEVHQRNKVRGISTNVGYNRSRVDRGIVNPGNRIQEDVTTTHTPEKIIGS